MISMILLTNWGKKNKLEACLIGMVGDFCIAMIIANFIKSL